VAHVSVTTQTPTGQWVDLDPVAWPMRRVAGEPVAGFRWAAGGPGVEVSYHDLDGRRVAGAGGAMQIRTWEPQVLGNMSLSTGPIGPTLYSGRVGVAEDGYADVFGPEGQEDEPHMVAVPPDDEHGPRVLALPGYEHDLFRRGAVVEGAPAVSQFGEIFRYSGDLDLWVPSERYLGDAPLGSLRDRLRQGWLRLRKRVRRVLQPVINVGRKIVQGVRKVGAAILNSKIVQRLLGATLRVFGIPARATRALMAAAGDMMRRGGIIELFRLLKRDPKAALRMLAGSVAAAGKAALGLRLPQLRGFAGVEDGGPAGCYEVLQDDGQRYHAAPVAALAGLPGVFSGGIVVTPTPTPGSYYTAKPGDSLLGISGAAYGLKAGDSERLRRAGWIGASPQENPLRHRIFPNRLPLSARVWKLTA